MRKLIIPVIVAGLAFFSCKKSSDKPGSSGSHTTDASGTLSGFWFGVFTNGNQGEVFEADGTTTEYDFYGTNSTDTATCPYKAYGNYTITGDTVRISVVYPTLGESFTEVATVDTTVKPFAMSGTYTGSQAGSFMMSKQ